MSSPTNLFTGLFGSNSAGSQRAETRDNAKEAVNNYWDRTQNANTNLQNSINNYSNAYKNDLDNASNQYNRSMNTALNRYEQNTNQYVGNQGYQKRQRSYQESSYKHDQP